MAKQKEFQPCVFVLDEKHGAVYMNALTEEALHKSALSVLRGRLAQTSWYDDEFAQEARLVVQRKQGAKALDLLRSRRHCEYEGYSLEPLQTQYDTSKDEAE